MKNIQQILKNVGVAVLDGFRTLEWAWQRG